MKVLVTAALVVSLVAVGHAQTTPTAVLFNSVDHASTLLVSYQALLLPATGIVPVQTGPVLPKATATVVAGTTPVDYRLSFTQMGVSIPACTTSPCPQYRLALVASGPGGTNSVSGVNTSVPFGATPPPPPDAPSNLRPIP